MVRAAIEFIGLGLLVVAGFTVALPLGLAAAGLMALNYAYDWRPRA